MIDLFGRLKNIISKTDYLQDLEDGVYFDSVTGGAGTDWPVGTAQSPSNVIASVITMCTARKTKKIYVNGALTLGATMEGYTFVGNGFYSTIDLNSKDVDTSVFQNCFISGIQGGTGNIVCYNCLLYYPTGLSGNFFNCTGLGTPKTSGTINFVNLNIGGSYTLDLTGLANIRINLWGLKGNLTITNSASASNNIAVYGNSCLVTMDAGNTAGTIIVYGDADLTKCGLGITETDNSIQSKIAAVNTLVAATKAGKSNMKVTTVDLHNGAGALDVATCATQAVIIDSIVFSPRVDISDDAGAFTGISIQDNDTTVHQFISTSSGLKTNLTQYAQLSWTGAIKIRVGNKIQCTIIGASTEADPTTCDVEITYHAVVDGGTL
jgi:hypothetical protein